MSTFVASQIKRYEYWNHFIARWALEGGASPYITKAKLAKIKPRIMDDNEFWTDVIMRHDGDRLTPEQMQRVLPATYDHCSGNFWGMITQTIQELGMRV